MSSKIAQLDLNLLRVFDALMEEQHLSRAAERLNLSQPATSNALARLREHLDEPLFVRTSRGMQPTARALALHGPVRQALRLIEEGLSEGGEFDPKASDRVFALSMNDYAQAWVLPSLVSRVRDEAPGIGLSVHTDLADTIPARLAAGTLDLAIDYLHFDSNELVYEPLSEEPLVVIGRALHPAFEGGLSVASFETARHVGVHPRAGRGSPLEIVLGSAKIRRNVALYVPFYLSIPAIVAESDLLGTVPARLADRFAKLYPLVSASLPVAMPPIQVSLIWHRRHASSRGLGWLRAVLHDCVTSVSKGYALASPGSALTPMAPVHRNPPRRRPNP